MPEWEINEDVFVSAIENFFEIEKKKFGQDFKVDDEMVNKAYRTFGNQKLINEYLSKNYPEYELPKAE